MTNYVFSTHTKANGHRKGILFRVWPSVIDDQSSVTNFARPSFFSFNLTMKASSGQQFLTTHAFIYQRDETRRNQKNDEKELEKFWFVTLSPKKVISWPRSTNYCTFLSHWHLRCFSFSRVLFIVSHSIKDKERFSLTRKSINVITTYVYVCRGWVIHVRCRHLRGPILRTTLHLWWEKKEEKIRVT